jgi:hypothetical protein
MSERTFQPKEIIFYEGDTSDFAYVILSGRVEILKKGSGGEIKLAELEAGAVFGEMSLFESPDAVRSATARAQTETVVEVITNEKLHGLIDQCPPQIIPIIRSVFDRLRAINTRVSKVEQATITLDSDIEKITVEAAPGALEGVFQPVTFPVLQLPYKIGGYPKDGSPSRYDQNNLYLPCEGPPLVISRHHCEIAVEDNAIYLIDMGSRFNTIVNGQPIGRGKGKYRATLVKGENIILLGGQDSVYGLKITLA